MNSSDWLAIIDQAAAAGVAMVQFIGGEPTLHPHLPAFIDHALGVGLKVEVFTNLVHVSPVMWETFAKPGVRLATSYYSDHAAEHVAVTKRAGSHRHTRANIVEALRRDIPIRVGVIGLRDAQRVDEAVAELRRLGVKQVSVDHMRSVGRGGAGCASDLCGGCAGEVAAVAPDGSVWPCVFSRWLPVGNVREAPFADILAGQRNLDVRRELAAEFQQRSPAPSARHADPQADSAGASAAKPDYMCSPMVFEPDSQPSPEPADTKAIYCVPQFEAEPQETPAAKLDYMCSPMVFEPDSQPSPEPADTKAIYCVPQFEAEPQETPVPLDINASR